MSSTNIPPIVKMKLIAASGGRCQYRGCNEYLFRDEVTMRAVNKSYFAHIVGDEPGGPRGDPVQSPLLAKDLSNLMLMCDVHHRLIDREEEARHPVSLLREMKQEHEARIETLSSIQPDRKSTVVLFGSKIGEHGYPLNFQRAIDAMVPDAYPSDQHPIELSIRNLAIQDHEPQYWALQAENLRRQYSDKVLERLQSGNISALSIFALAPQPLLILFGSLVGDIVRADVFQKHREPDTWRWQEHTDGFEFKIGRPSSLVGEPALVLSLSATVEEDRIREILGDNCSIWTMTIEKPHNDFLKSKKQSSMFRARVRSLLDEIKARHGENALLHVFPAMPVACAIEFGRVVMPKADLGMRLYDQNWKANGFVKTIDLNPR